MFRHARLFLSEKNLSDICISDIASCEVKFVISIFAYLSIHIASNDKNIVFGNEVKKENIAHCRR